jgi:cobalt-zinc-cadmium efflux system protein
MAQGGMRDDEADRGDRRPPPPSLIFHHHQHQDHHRPPGATGTGLSFAFATAAVINFAFVGAEAAAGVLGNSVALLSDAGHNLGDVLGLLLAWAASLLVRRGPTRRFTYGLRSTSILAALFNAIILFIAVGGVTAEAIRRLIEPAPVASLAVILVAAVGILVNGVTAWLFGGARQRADLNLRAVFLHMAVDAVISAVVVGVGIAIYFTGIEWLDPLSSLAIALFILVGSWRLLRDGIHMAVQAVPAGIDASLVNEYLARTPGVAAVHDLHIWPMSTTETALTCHLVMPGAHPGDALLAELAHGLHDRFAIEHVTIQIESGDPAHPCALVPDHVV